MPIFLIGEKRIISPMYASRRTGSSPAVRPICGCAELFCGGTAKVTKHQTAGLEPALSVIYRCSTDFAGRQGRVRAPRLHSSSDPFARTEGRRGGGGEGCERQRAKPRNTMTPCATGAAGPIFSFILIPPIDTPTLSDRPLRPHSFTTKAKRPPRSADRHRTKIALGMGSEEIVLRAKFITNEMGDSRQV